MPPSAVACPARSRTPLGSAAAVGTDCPRSMLGSRAACMAMARILEEFKIFSRNFSKNMRKYLGSLFLIGVGTDDFIPATFPLSQLTNLDIDAAVTTFGVRDILSQCTALQSAKLHELFEWDSDDPPPPRNIFTLKHLIHLDISFGLGARPAGSVGRRAARPPRSLALPPHSPLARPSGSHSPPAHLSPPRAARAPDARYRYLHPRLELLGVHPVTDFNGEVVARVAEYLAACAGDPSSAFPLLRKLHIYRRDRHPFASSFSIDVEQRLAAVCATGFLVEGYYQ
ncbi:hypothetical protein C8R47DRAFT_1077367 [Mycena vitilis]|nr:hypothetical protein C8R47DRAFT_1077367 [Mycena vitilis]